jgi:dTDP-4-amino-4,6-dideoxygalactose transaminase
MNFNLDLMLPYKEKVTDAMLKVVEDQHYIHGPVGREFEIAFSHYNEQAHTIGVGSGTDAIRIALLALGVGPGDEVISPAFNVAYTALAVAAIGATNVFVDCYPETMLMDVSLVARAITPKTRAIIPVHLFGQMVQMEELRTLAQQNGLLIVEDAAQCHGSFQNFLPLGQWSHAVAYSFYPTKNLGCLGEGGAITTNIDAVADMARLLRDGGRTDRYLHSVHGLNSGLDELQAAVLRVKLKYLDQRNDARRRAAAYYVRELSGVGDLRLPVEGTNNHHVYHLFVIRTAVRTELREFLISRGIPTLIHYPVPVPYQPCFMPSEFGGPWPEAERAAREVMSLPMHADITREDQDKVIAAVKEFFNEESSA